MEGRLTSLARVALRTLPIPGIDFHLQQSSKYCVAKPNAHLKSGMCIEPTRTTANPPPFVVTLATLILQGNHQTVPVGPSHFHGAPSRTFVSHSYLPVVFGRSLPKIVQNSCISWKIIKRTFTWSRTSWLPCCPSMWLLHTSANVIKVDGERESHHAHGRKPSV